MRGFRVFIAVVLIATTAAGCAGRPSQSTESVAAGSVPPCPNPPPSREGEPWRGALGSGFIFCVPASWLPQGSRSWRGEGGSVEWSAGARPREQPVAILGRAIERPEYRTSVEIIGGEEVEITTVRSRSPVLFHASARWKTSDIYFQGEARSPSDIAVLVDIYRSVRRSAP